MSLVDTVGIAEESTYGTILAPTKFHEFLEESIVAAEEDVKSAAVPLGRRLLSSSRWAQGRAGAEGGLSLEYLNKGCSYLWKHILGSQSTIVVSGVPGARKAVLGDLFGKSLTLQKSIGRVNGSSVDALTYAGGKVLEWELANEVDGILGLSLGLDFQKEDTATARTTPTYTASTIPFVWTGGVIQVAGADFPVRNVSFQGNNGFKTDRYLLKSANSRLKSEPVSVSRPTIQGELVAEFDGLTPYQRFKNGTLATLKATWTTPGVEISAGKPYMLEVSCGAVRFTGSTPQSAGEDLNEQSLPFEVLDDGTVDGGFVVITHEDT